MLARGVGLRATSPSAVICFLELRILAGVMQSPASQIDKRCYAALSVLVPVKCEPARTVRLGSPPSRTEVLYGARVTLPNRVQVLNSRNMR